MVTTPVVSLLRRSVRDVHEHSFTNEGPGLGETLRLTYRSLNVGFEECLPPLPPYTGCVREVLTCLYGVFASTRGSGCVTGHPGRKDGHR